MTDVRELLPLYALGVLDAAESTAVERAAAADPTIAAELAAYHDVAGALSAAAPAVAPPPHVATRLLASVGSGRFERFTARLAELFDVSVARARELVGLAERPASWERPIPGLGVSLVHFDAGPAYATADCGFIRIDPGCTFPWHTHRGEEVSVILAGTMRDHDGRRFGPGDELVQAVGSQHDLTVEGDEPVIFAARAILGIEVGQRR